VLPTALRRRRQLWGFFWLFIVGLVDRRPAGVHALEPEDMGVEHEKRKILALLT
jgi:hypothetical protein